MIKALVKFFSTFRLPKCLQSDQGTNSTSALFNQMLQELGIKNIVSSPYHPESQGVLERFRQSLKTMLRSYCFDTQHDWDEGVPLVLFAVREVVQESLGFSPTGFVFGHMVRGPLKVLKEKLLSDGYNAPKQNILNYVSDFKSRLCQACECAKRALLSLQIAMKRRSVQRSFKSGDKVLALLPVPGSALSAHFSGPYSVEKKFNETTCYWNTGLSKKEAGMPQKYVQVIP